jgi:hypothetical protein
MGNLTKMVAAFGIVALFACARHPAANVATNGASSCADRGTQLIAANVSAIAVHRYADASQAAERAARIALTCASREGSAAVQFGDRWRAANALVVAAELAHQANDLPRAHHLLHEGYAVMHTLRPPDHLSPLTSTLIAQQLDTARRDLHGEWAAW